MTEPKFNWRNPSRADEEGRAGARGRPKQHDEPDHSYWRSGLTVNSLSSDELNEADLAARRAEVHHLFRANATLIAQRLRSAGVFDGDVEGNGVDPP